MFKSPLILVGLCMLMFLTYGCSFSEKATNLKDDLINITKDQVAQQFENSLNQNFPGVQLNVPNVTNGQGDIDWQVLKGTELGEYVFYNFGEYEFRAVLSGDGVFRIERINYATQETFAYAEFQVSWNNGKFQVSAK